MAPTTKETVSALLADVQEAKLRRRRGEPVLEAVDEYEDAQSEEDTSDDEQTLPLDFPAPPPPKATGPKAAPPEAEGSALRLEAESLWSSACLCVVLLILFVVFILSQYPL
jgi:hypothetical protein